MTWPLEDPDRAGLLPDFILLKSQIRDGPAINPGTTQAHVPELFDAGTIYDVTRLPFNGCFVHAPCAIRDVTEDETGATFALDGWGTRQNDIPYHVLLSGWNGAIPNVTVWKPGEEPDPSANRSFAEHAFVAGSQLLVVRVNGPAVIRISRPAQ